MAQNPPANYGLDIACVTDANPFWSTAVGLPVVEQDAYHRVTNDDVLGPGGVGWGRDVRRLLGARTSTLAAEQVMFAQVLQRDQRIQSATVAITPTRRADGLADVRFVAVCVTAVGSFDLVIPSILDLTAGTIEAQA
jgi:hypothetical protein